MSESKRESRTNGREQYSNRNTYTQPNVSEQQIFNPTNLMPNEAAGAFFGVNQSVPQPTFERPQTPPEERARIESAIPGLSRDIIQSSVDVLNTAMPEVNFVNGGASAEAATSYTEQTSYANSSYNNASGGNQINNAYEPAYSGAGYGSSYSNNYQNNSISPNGNISNLTPIKSSAWEMPPSSRQTYHSSYQGYQDSASSDSPFMEHVGIAPGANNMNGGGVPPITPNITYGYEGYDDNSQNSGNYSNNESTNQNNQSNYYPEYSNSGLAQDVYALTDGRVSLGGLATGETGAGGIATQVYTWSTQGTRDTQNNSFYDVSKRMERTMAVLSIVGSTYEEKREATVFTRTDWKDEKHQAHLQRLHFNTNFEAQATALLTDANTDWIMWGGATQGESVKGHIKDFSAENLNKAQLNQLMATGSCIYNGQRISATAGGEYIGAKLQALNNEQRRISRTFDISDNDQARYALRQIRGAQISHLTDVATSHGMTKFTGSKRDVAELERTLKKEKEDLLKSGVKLKDTKNMTPEDISKLTTEEKRLITITGELDDTKIFKETGGTIGGDGKKSAGSMQANRRAYGRQIVMRSVTGDEMNQGIAIYRNAYRLTRSATKVAVRATVMPVVKATHLITKGVAYAGRGTKFETGAKMIGDTADKLGEKSQDFGRKKSKGEKRARREERSDRRIARGNARFSKRSEKLESKIADRETLKEKGLLSAKDQKKLDRDLRKRENRTVRGQKRFAWQEKRSAKRTKRADRRRRINNIRFTIAKFNPINIINRVGDFIKRNTIKAAGIAILGFLFSLILAGGIACIFAYSTNFISSLVEGEEEVNYIQLIVNDTAGELSAQFESVAKNDAETHFLIDDPIPSNNGYDWYKMVTEGEIEHIWASDEMNKPEASRTELTGLSANLLQITSMMHYRYNDEIDFDSYNTAKAYEYYMFVRTHRVAEDANGNPTYSYIEADNHDNNSLYSSRPVYYPGPKTVFRGEETCENVYVHGYNNISFGNDATVALAVNRARATMEGFMTKCVTAIFGQGAASSMNRTAEGLWINEVPHDNHSVCDNYAAYPLGYDDDDDALYTTAEGGSCPGYTHVHKHPDCYEERITHQDEEGKPVFEDVLVCPLQEHTHAHWYSEYNPGCYKTAYLCKGHCGGHIQPTVNVEIDMDWKDLIQYDSFRTPYFLAPASFNSIMNWSNCRTIEAWADKWMNRASAWFFPFPDSPITAVQWCGHKLAGLASNIVSSMINHALGIEPEDIDVEEDVYGFEGWWLPNGQIDESLIDDLESFYGKYEDNFKEGVEAWKDFEVIFPTGSGQSLTDDQIASVLEQVKQGYPGISSRSLAVIEEALKGVGQYYYSLTGSAHMNAIHNTGGAGECSGFVSGVLNRALGTNYNNSAAGYYSLGSGRAMYAGDIIATNHTSGHTIATGHVLIYVGHLPEGIPGYKITNQSTGISKEQSGSDTYVIDCTPTYGGSVFRKYNNLDGLHAWNGY